MADKIEDLKKWIERDLSRAGSECVEIKEADIDWSENRKRFQFSIYTYANKYLIVAKEQSDYRLSYLGCTSTSRKSRADENCLRGYVLAGPLNEETWNKILARIVSYELVKVCKKKDKKEISRRRNSPLVEKL